MYSGKIKKPAWSPTPTHKSSSFEPVPFKAQWYPPVPAMDLATIQRLSDEHPMTRAIAGKPPLSQASEEHEPTTQTTIQAKPEDEHQSPIEHVGDFGKGLYEGGKDALTGLGSMARGAWNLTGGWVSDPKEAQSTWEHLKGTTEAVVHNPGLVWEGIKAPYEQAWQSGHPGEAFGRGTFEALSFLAGTKGLDKLAKGSKLAEAVAAGEKVEEAATVTSKVGGAVKSTEELVKEVGSVVLPGKAASFRSAAKGVAQSSKQAADLSRHLGYAEKYGADGVKQLENGRFRYYGEVQPANKAGEMAGRRYVHEFDPTSGGSRGWHETVDHAGTVRQVRPELNNGSKTHYRFDSNGNYTGSW
ncbi:hypothetical protein [Anthocerotibacter panamensis]|uniref:hypothetical protein n=1 Tax=Anthocerotibacter panamensis TaxID=2857077 RepID=UPI001C404451|nr:hypothetical protein [Anthocerotibacter panamensis]